MDVQYSTNFMVGFTESPALKCRTRYTNAHSSRWTKGKLTGQNIRRLFHVRQCFKERVWFTSRDVIEFWLSLLLSTTDQNNLELFLHNMKLALVMLLFLFPSVDIKKPMQPGLITGLLSEWSFEVESSCLGTNTCSSWWVKLWIASHKICLTYRWFHD